jgi:hypothetical protein
MSNTALSFNDGGSALIRDPRQVPQKLRRPFTRALMAMGAHGAEIDDHNPGMSEEDAEKAHKKAVAIAMALRPELNEEYNETLMLALISEWSYGDVTRDALDELPVDTYDVILKHCEKLAPQLSPSFEVSKDPKVTTDE